MSDRPLIRTGPLPPTGSFLLGASAATATALAVPGERFTAFTGELIAVLDAGIDGGDPVLRMDALFAHLDTVLEQKRRPRPWPEARGHGGGIVLARNVAFRQPGPVLPETLAGLARAQRRAGDAFPYRLAGAHRTHLDAVYVRQDLRRSSAERADSTDDAETAETARKGSGGTDASPQGPAVMLDDLLRTQRHLIVVGSAGQGKTTMTLRLATRLADEWLRTTQNPPAPASELSATSTLGIRVTARALTEESGPWDQMIAHAATRELGATLDRELPSDLLDLAPAGAEWLVIVDGLDEIADPWNRREVIRQLAERAAHDPRLRLLLTTRDLPGDELEILEKVGVAPYALAPFEKEQLTAFIKAWFGPGPEGERLAAGFLAGIEEAGPSELLRVPLFATVAAILYQQHPERRLPGSVFLLYEQYLGYLAAARFEQTARQWLDIRARVAAALDGDATSADRLQAERGTLVEHLAVRAVAGEGDLLSAAVSWMDEHGGLRARTRIPDWPDLIASMLDATGLFLHTPHLRFVHLSLAEHLAASAHARQLPATFDPADPAWGDLARAPGHNKEDVLLAVLLHHAHQHPGADDALTWLESGTIEYRMIAGRLLADGFPASPAHMASFLATLQDAVRQAREHWHGSMLTKGIISAARLHDEKADQMLLETARDRELLAELRMYAAALLPRRHRNVTVHTLRDIIADRAIDLDERQEAAGALAQLEPEFATEAVQALLTMASQPAISMYGRRASARGIARLGPAHAAVAADILRSIITDTSSDEGDREDAATTLAELGPAYTAEAARALRDIMNGPTGDDDDRCSAAMELAELDPACAAEAAAVLRAAVARRPEARMYRRVARNLSQLGTAYTHEAAEVLRALITEPTTDNSDREAAAEALADLDPAYAMEAAETLRSVIGDPATDPSDLEDAADALADLGAQFIPEAVSVLRSLSTDAGVDSDIRRRAAVKVAKNRPESTPEAAELLATLGAETAMDLDRQIEALDALGNLGPQYAAEVIHFYRSALTHSATSVLAKLRIAKVLLESDTDTATKAVRTVLSDPSVSAAHRCSAATLLADWAPEHATVAVDALRAVMGASTSDFDDRRTAAQELRDFGPEFRSEANQALHTILLARDISVDERVGISAELTAGGGELPPPAVQALQAVLTDPATGSYNRSEAARVFGKLETEHTEAAAEALRTEIRSTSDSGFRWQAVDALAALGPRYSMEAAGIARAELADPAAGSYERRRAAQVMAQLGPEYATRAVEALHTLLTDSTVEPFDRHWVASALAVAERSFAARTAEILLAGVADRGLDPYVRWHAALALQHAGVQFADSAASALLTGATTGPEISVADRIDAARLLAGPSFRDTDRAAEVVRFVIDDNATSRTDRWLAAGVLAELAPRHTDQAARVLRAIIPDTAASLFDRRWCAVALARLGPGYADEAALGLRMTLSDCTESFDRRWNAVALSLLGPGHIAEAAEILHAMLADPDADPWDLKDTATAMANLGPRYVTEAAEALHAVIGDPESDLSTRQLAADALSRLGPDHAAEANESLHAMLDDPETLLSEYWPIARSLIDLDPEFAQQAVGIARAVLTDDDIGTFNRCNAALMLADLIPEAAPEAAEALHAVISDQSAHPVTRCIAASYLIKIDSHGVARVAEDLHAILGRPDTEAHARVYAASILARLGPDHTAGAVEIMRSVLSDPTIEPDTRRDAATHLARLGHEYMVETATALETIIAEAAPDDAIRPSARSALAEIHQQPHAEAEQAERGTISYPPATDTRHIAGELLADLQAAVIRR